MSRSHARTHARTDGRTDRRTDSVKTVYPPQTKFAGGIISLTFCMLGNFSCFSCRLLTFFKINFSKIISGTLSECQMFWIQIRPDILPGLIWVKTACKDYKQTTKFTAGRQQVKFIRTVWPSCSYKQSLEVDQGKNKNMTPDPSGKLF